MDGKEVRLIVDICDEHENVIQQKGATFTWSDDCEFQLVRGELVYVDRDEVELVNW